MEMLYIFIVLINLIMFGFLLSIIKGLKRDSNDVRIDILREIKETNKRLFDKVYRPDCIIEMEEIRRDIIDAAKIVKELGKNIKIIQEEHNEKRI